MKVLRNILCLGCVVSMLAACTEDDYKVYDTTQKDSVFFQYKNNRQEVDTIVDYSFGYDIANVHTVEIPVILMGMPSSTDRVIAVAALPDSTTMIEGTHYTIENAVIPAGEVSGVIKVNLLRDRDPELLNKQYKLRLIINENDDLRSVKNSFFKIVYSDIRPTVAPVWWPRWGGFPTYSFENVQLFFDYFYRLAPEANLSIYNEMIEGYGHYFVNARSQQGPFVNYDAFLRNYVSIPLYNEHPEVTWLENPNW